MTTRAGPTVVIAGGGVRVTPAETSLEDVFIQFMGASEDNMA